MYHHNTQPYCVRSCILRLLLNLQVVFIHKVNSIIVSLLENNLTGVQHVGIFTADLEMSLAWYVEKFNFYLTSRETFSFDGQAYQLAFLELGNLVIELVHPPEVMRAEVAARDHGSIDHIALDTLDIETALQAAQAKGVSLHSSTADGIVDFGIYPEGVRYVFFEGPTGEKIELAQRNDLDSQRRTENVRGWNHLGIPTVDIDASRDFYQRLGFVQDLYAEVSVDNGVVKILMMKLGNFILEFFQIPGAALPNTDGKIDHIALDVRDAQAAYDELKAAGLLLMEDAPISLAILGGGVKFFNIRGPNGAKVEFNELLT